MTGFAGIRADKFCARNIWRREDCAIRFKSAARKQNDGERGCSPNPPPQLFAFTVQPYDWPDESHVPRLLSDSAKITTHLFGKSNSGELPNSKAFSAIQAFCSKFARRSSRKLFEDAIELGEGLKPDGKRDLAHAKIGIFQ